MFIRYLVTINKITQQQKCDRCPNVKLVSEDDDLDIQIDKGNQNIQNLKDYSVSKC